MKKYIYYGILIIVCPLMVLIAGLYGIDREMARNDYNNGKWAEHCIFQSNCNHYNNLETKGIDNE